MTLTNRGFDSLEATVAKTKAQVESNMNVLAHRVASHSHGVVPNMPAISVFTATSNATTTSTGTWVPVSPTCSGTFVAPPSGTVVVFYSASTFNSAATYNQSSVEVRAGGTVGSGTVVKSGTASPFLALYGAINISTQAEQSFRVTGLTAGATYNVEMQHRTGAGTLTAQARQIMVVPYPKYDGGLFAGSGGGGGGSVNSVTAGDTTVNIGGTASDPTVTVNEIAQSQVIDLLTDLAALAPLVHTHPESDVTGLVTDLAGKQPLDSDLTAIAALTPTNDDVVQRKSGAWVNRSMAQLGSDLGLAGTYQPLDSDLTSIAGLSPTNDDFIQRKSGAWVNRSMAQLSSDLGLASTYQPLDSDLTAIAGLSPTNDDLVQRKGGAWVNRTVAQVKSDFGLAAVATSGAYSDLTGTPSAYTDEQVRDVMGTALTAGANVTITVNDAGDTITINSTAAGSGGGGAVNTVTATNGTIVVDNTDAANPTVAVGTIAQSQVTSLVTDLAGKQASDADLTAIAALTPTNDDVIQRKSGAWVNRSIAQLSSDLGLAAGYQPLDSDLTAVAALTPTNDDLLQRKAGAWVNRSVAQVKTDLGLTNVTNDAQVKASLVTTKGDLVTATASAAPARLAVGTNGYVLTADSTQATGLNWTPAATGGGGGTTNYYTPITNATFSATAGASNVYTLPSTNYGVQLVFLNGQQLQTSEYSSNSTTCTVTPASGALQVGDKVSIVYNNAQVLDGTLAADLSFPTATTGVVLVDRVSGVSYRLFMSGGVLGTETV